MLSICCKLQKFSYIYNKATCLKNLIRRHFLKLLLHWRWKEETIQHKCDNNKHHLQVATCPWNKIRASKFGHMQKGLKQHCPLNVYLFLSISPASFPVLPPMFLFTWTFITLNYGGKSFHEKLRIVKLFCGCQGYRAL